MSSSPSKKLVNCFWIKAGCDVCEKWTVVFFFKKEWKWDTYIRNKIRRGRCPLLVKFVFQIQRLGPRAGQAAVNPSQNTWNGLAYHWNDKQSNFSNISTSSKKKKFCLSGLWCCWDQENRQKEKKKKPRVRSTRLPPLVLSANHVTRVQGKDNVSLARLIQKGGKRRRDQPLVSKIFFFFSKRFVSSWLCLLSRLRLVVECGRVASFVCEEEMTTDKSVKSSRSDKRRVCKCCSTFPRYSISQICFHLSRKDQQAVDGEKTSSADQSQSVCSQVAHYQRRSRSRHTHAFSWYYIINVNIQSIYLATEKGKQFQFHFAIAAGEGGHSRTDSHASAGAGEAERGALATATTTRAGTRWKRKQQCRQWRQIVSTWLSSVLPRHWTLLGRSGLDKRTVDGAPQRAKAEHFPTEPGQRSGGCQCYHPDKIVRRPSSSHFLVILFVAFWWIGNSSVHFFFFLLLFVIPFKSCSGYATVVAGSTSCYSASCSDRLTERQRLAALVLIWNMFTTQVCLSLLPIPCCT